MQKVRYARKKFITKFIHQVLPMGAVYHKIDPPSLSRAACAKCIPNAKPTSTNALLVA